MRVVDPGHMYELRELDGETGENWLLFVKRDGPGYPGNVGAHAGTTTQEVLRALIDRTKYVDNQIADPQNLIVLNHLRQAIYALELRAAIRHGRRQEFISLVEPQIHVIETLPTCDKCNHIDCPGMCH